MTKRKLLTVGKFLILLNLAWFFIVSVLLFNTQALHLKLLYKQNAISELAKEIRWQRYVADKAKIQVRDLPELQFLSSVMETRDADLYSISKASWKWGKVYRVSPYLIMAVARCESNFDPVAVSHNRDGSPCAYGTMQINVAVWKPDMAKIFEVDYNVKLGTEILKMYLDKNPGDISAALFDYWGGSLAGGSYLYPDRVLNSPFYNSSVGIR